MNTAEQFFASMKSRMDLIGKAVLTAKTGDQGRKVIKLLETFIINNNSFVAKTVAANGIKYCKIL